MDDQARGKNRNLLWLLVILLLVVIWWFWKPRADNGTAALAGDWNGADPDDILVDLVDDATDADVAAIEAKLGIDLVLVSDESLDERFYRAHVDPARRDALLGALSAMPIVEIAEPDAEVHLIEPGVAGAVPEENLDGSGFPNDPMYKFQWHLRQIGMPAAWKMAQGKGVIVAVIDTGVAYGNYKQFHRVPDLAGTKFTKPYNFVANNRNAHDDHGHGTHVAGTIAQATHNKIGVAGVAPRATIMPLKVLTARGSGSVGAIADAIRYAADNDAKVINMSLGGPFPSKILQRAVAYARNKGVVVVCAAGNDGRGRVSYPAAYPGAFAVAATQLDERTTFYSNWGKEIDIAAPGGNTKEDRNNDGMPDGVVQNTIVIGDPTRDGYFPYMGTSMASPHVAGVAALVASTGITEPAAIEKILADSARKPRSGVRYEEARYGAGIVDAPAALRKARGKKGTTEAALALVMALAVAAGVRRKAAFQLVPYAATAVFAASGLFFLPLVVSDAASWPVLGMLTHGIPSWDLSLFGPQAHGNAIFFSALIPLGLIAVCAGVSRLRGVLAGLAVGVGAHLVFQVVARTTDVHWIPGWLDALWLLLNAALCVVLAHLTLKRR